MSCTFHPSPGVAWAGRYDRILGDQSVFHIRSRTAEGRFWPMAERRIDGETVDYWFKENAAINALAEAIKRLQLHFNGAEGGSFTINEYGQVIVPSGPETATGTSAEPSTVAGRC